MIDEWEVGSDGSLFRNLTDSLEFSLIDIKQEKACQQQSLTEYSIYHDLKFHMLHCLQGSVRLVYELQGPPFVFSAGDILLEPPLIRHQVLEKSTDLRILEFSSPVERATYAEFETQLPTYNYDPEAKFCGQNFKHFRRQDAIFTNAFGMWASNCWKCCNTLVDEASGNKLSAVIYVLDDSRPISALATNTYFKHSAGMLYFRIIAGYMDIFINLARSKKHYAGSTVILNSTDAVKIGRCSANIEFVAVATPGDYQVVPCPNPRLAVEKEITEDDVGKNWKDDEKLELKDMAADIKVDENTGVFEISKINEKAQTKILSSFIDKLEHGISITLHYKQAPPKKKIMLLLKNSLRWYSTNTILQYKSLKLAPQDIVRVEMGKKTPVFATEYAAGIDEDTCFSLCTEYVSVDLQADNKMERDGMVIAFRILSKRLRTSTTIAI